MLWSTFHIDCKACTHVDNMKNMADLWFFRSGTHPLDVALVVQNLEDIAPLLSVLGQHAPHIRSLHLYTLTDDFKPLEVLQMDFRMLERLAIHVLGSGSVDGVVAPWPSGVTVQAFSSASTLSEISLHGSRIPLVCFALPRAHMTHLDATARGVGEMLQMLQHPPNLAHLFITVDDWDGILPGVISLRVHHSRLRTFHCRFAARNSPSFLDCLIFPSLEALAILPSETSVPLSLDLLERSSARLKKLRLYPLWGMVQPLPDVSAFKQPSLSRLQELDIINPASGTFEAFCNAIASDPGFLPELRALAVGLREDADLVVYTRQVVQLVAVSFEKRLSVAVCASLCSLRVAWPPQSTVDLQLEPSALKSFQAVKNSGVEVYVGGDSDECVSLI
ncbi:F-box domain-containing protein [Mycena chlorophos]|uniref:F-box domain-containing protein n=1 Tax=Mycena chlorophos TaxID=658473 RepID=A0A8H6S700_MYCCL|nr:F-box domain-containing protein [Mycena chlorophos]